MEGNITKEKLLEFIDSIPSAYELDTTHEKHAENLKIRKQMISELKKMTNESSEVANILREIQKENRNK